MKNDKSEEMEEHIQRLKEYRERRREEWQEKLEKKEIDNRNQGDVLKSTWRDWEGWKTLIITVVAFVVVFTVFIIGNMIAPQSVILWGLVGFLGIPFVFVASIWSAIVFHIKGDKEKAAGVWIGIGIVFVSLAFLLR